MSTSIQVTFTENTALPDWQGWENVIPGFTAQTYVQQHRLALVYGMWENGLGQQLHCIGTDYEAPNASAVQLECSPATVTFERRYRADSLIEAFAGYRQKHEHYQAAVADKYRYPPEVELAWRVLISSAWSQAATLLDEHEKRQPRLPEQIPLF